MSIATQPIPPVLPMPSAAKRERFGGKNIWALGDQALISGSNFITMVLAVRAMGDGFGVFTLAYSILLLANILQSTLVTQAHNVIAATQTGSRYRIYTANTAFSQLLLAGIEAALVLLVAGVLALRHSPSALMFAAVAPAIVAWQFQEFIRRVLYTESRYAGAFWNDIISYGGQTVIVIALFTIGWLTGINALLALTVSSVAAVVIGLWQIRKSLKFSLDWSVFTENWHFGKWLTGGELLQWFASLQMYLFLTAWMLGTEATGHLRAAQVLFGPTRIFAYYLGTMLPIRFARALANKGPYAVNDLLRNACIRVIPLLGLYCLLIAVFPSLWLHLTYGEHYTGAPIVLSLYAISAFLSYVQMLLLSALMAKRLTRPIFMGNVYGAVIALAMSYWIIHWFNVAGAPIAMGVSSVIITGYFLYAYMASRGAEVADRDRSLEPAGALS